MLPYISIFILFAVLSVLTPFKENKDRFNTLLFIAFVLFAGLRYETGNDWLTYQNFYQELQSTDISSLSINDIFSYEYEPLFVLSLVPLIIAQLPFQAVLFLTALFNGVVIFKFLKRFSANPALVAVVYLGLAYLPGQMAMIRQSIAASFVLLAVMANIDRKYILSLLYIVLACGFHLSSVLFLIPMLASAIKPSIKVIIAIFITAIFVAIIIVKYISLLSLLLPLLPFVFGDKLSIYMDAVFRPSFASLVYIAANIIFLVILFIRKNTISSFRLYTASFWMIGFMLFCQISLYFLPVFWNRVQLVSIVLEISALSVMMTFNEIKKYLFIVSFIALGSFIIYFKSLKDPAMISYVPYQIYLMDDDDSGESRFYDALYEHINRNIEN